MTLLNFIESLLIPILWAKVFQFFECIYLKLTNHNSISIFWVYLLEIDQSQLKKSKCEIDQSQLKKSCYNLLLSAWLVSMEIYPKEIFIYIWHLSFQIKVHKENIRTKCKTSDGYSGPYRTSNMTLFAKALL